MSPVAAITSFRGTGMTSPESRLPSCRVVFLAYTLAACSPLAGTGPEATIGETVAPAGASPVIETAAVAGSLIGLQESDVVGMLGDPAFVWTQGHGRMWRYHGASCRLLVFLYPDGVRHTETLGGAEDSCLCEIRGDCT